MSRIDRRRARAAAVTAALTGGALLLAILAPGTSGAFTASVTNSGNTAATKTKFTCADTFANSAFRTGAYLELGLTETSGTTATDSGPAGNTGTYTSLGTKETATPTACPNDGGGAFVATGSNGVTTAISQSVAAPFSIVLWFKTPTGTGSAGGPLIGQQNQATGTGSTAVGKFLIIGTSMYCPNQLLYSQNADGSGYICSGTSVNDNAWHQVAITVSSTAGTAMYLDGAATPVAKSTSYTGASSTGYWRIAQGQVPSVGYSYFKGSLRFVAVHGVVLTTTQIASLYAIGKTSA